MDWEYIFKKQCKHVLIFSYKKKLNKFESFSDSFIFLLNPMQNLRRSKQQYKGTKGKNEKNNYFIELSFQFVYSVILPA